MMTTQVQVGDRVSVAVPGKARTVRRTVVRIDGDSFVTDKRETLPVAGINFNFTACNEGR